jgi:sodium/proline symporter
VSTATAILVTLIAYKIVLVTIGLIAQRHTHDATDYFLGGRRLGPWVAALSASASSSSAWSLLGVSGAAYAWGLGSLWIFVACVGGFVLNWYVLAPALRRHAAASEALTVTDVLAGPKDAPGSAKIRWACTMIVLVSFMTYIGAQFQGAGKTFHETFEISMTSAILLGGGIVVLYTLLGGFWAVSVTDTLQGMVMVVAAVALPIAALVEIGGVAPLADALADVPVAGFASLTRDLPILAALGFVLGLLGIGLGYPGQPHVVNRYMALRDDDAVAVAKRIAIAWSVVLYAGMLLLGLCARVLLPQLADPEAAFVASTQLLLPPVVAGVMIAAVLSAVMSTADSQLLVAASSVAHDLPIASRKGASLMQRSRIVVLVCSAFAMAAALVGDPEIFSKVLFAWSAMGAAFGPLLLVIVIAGPVGPRHRLAAILVGFGLSVFAYFLVPGHARGAAERVVPFVVAFAIAWAGRGRGTGTGGHGHGHAHGAR